MDKNASNMLGYVDKAQFWTMSFWSQYHLPLLFVIMMSAEGGLCWLQAGLHTRNYKNINFCLACQSKIILLQYFQKSECSL